MQINNRRRNVVSRHIVVTTVFILTFLFPVFVYAQSDSNESIAALKQMGKAFASIAEKASPSVVGVKSSKTVTREYLQSPFDDPSGNDFFDYFPFLQT